MYSLLRGSSHGGAFIVHESEFVERVFATALRRANRAEQEEYLEVACGADDAARHRVEALLAAHAQAGSFLQTTGEAANSSETHHDQGHAARLWPERIGRYRIFDVLGHGGFGVVYRARDEQLDREVAVKVPHDHLLESIRDGLFREEARTLAKLDHPHIVPVYDIGSDGKFVVFKYIEGTSLANQLQARWPEHYDVVRLMIVLAEALHYAHEQGVVHRDIKPGNILIDRHDTPYLVDFGLAVCEHGAHVGEHYAGTPAYMSPEQARGEGHRIDRRSDIFFLCPFSAAVWPRRSAWPTGTSLSAACDNGGGEDKVVSHEWHCRGMAWAQRGLLGGR